MDCEVLRGRLEGWKFRLLIGLLPRDITYGKEVLNLKSFKM